MQAVNNILESAMWNSKKVNQMCKNAVKNLLFGIRYVPNCYKAQQMCYKVILENGERFCLSAIATRITKFVIKLFIIMLMH